MKHTRSGFGMILASFLIKPGDSPGNCLYNWIEKLGNLLARQNTLFLIDDIIAGKTLNKQRQPLLGLAILGRHKGHLLWLLMQSYTAVPMNKQETSKDALCLASEEARRLGYDSGRE